MRRIVSGSIAILLCPLVSSAAFATAPRAPHSQVAATSVRPAHLARSGAIKVSGHRGAFNLPRSLQCSYDENNVFTGSFAWTKGDGPAAQMASYWHQPRHGGWNAQEVALYERYEFKRNGKWHAWNYREYIKLVKYGNIPTTFSQSQKHKNVVQSRSTAGATAFRETEQLVWFKPTTDRRKSNVKDGGATIHLKRYTTTLGDGRHSACPANYGPPWTKLNPPTAPTGAIGAASAYDKATSQIIVFGGSNGTTTNAETWSWDGTNWTQLHPQTSPPARMSAAMAYDDASHTIVMFGGSSSTGAPLGDTWVWNGTDWTQFTVAGPPSTTKTPPARASAAMAYSANADKIVMFGGSNGSSLPLGDTWTWTATGWTGTVYVNGPSPRAGAAAATNSAGDVALFGGTASGGELGDTWQWEPVNNQYSWVQLQTTTGPSAQAYAAMTYDPKAHAAILFAGSEGSLGTNSATWALTADRWVPLFPPASPPSREKATLNYDEYTGMLVLYGGGLGSPLRETWTLER